MGGWVGWGAGQFQTSNRTLKVGMTEANFSNKNLGAAGAIIISSWMSNKGDNGVQSCIKFQSWPLQFIKFYKGAMTVLNLASNFINAEGAKHIAGALKVSKCVLAVVFGTTFMPI